MPKITDSTHKTIKRTVVLDVNDIKELLTSRKAQNYLGALPDKYEMRIEVPDSYGMWQEITFSDDVLRIIITSEDHEEEEIKS